MPGLDVNRGFPHPSRGAFRIDSSTPCHPYVVERNLESLARKAIREGLPDWTSACIPGSACSVPKNQVPKPENFFDATDVVLEAIGGKLDTLAGGFGQFLDERQGVAPSCLPLVERYNLSLGGEE